MRMRLESNHNTHIQGPRSHGKNLELECNENISGCWGRIDCKRTIVERDGGCGDDSTGKQYTSHGNDRSSENSLDSGCI